jgi:hypothetical protein
MNESAEGHQIQGSLLRNVKGLIHEVFFSTLWPLRGGCQVAWAQRIV